MQTEAPKKWNLPKAGEQIWWILIVLGKGIGIGIFHAARLQMIKNIPSTIAGLTIDPFLSIVFSWIGIAIFVASLILLIKYLNTRTKRYRFALLYNFLRKSSSKYRWHRENLRYKRLELQKRQERKKMEVLLQGCRNVLLSIKINMPDPKTKEMNWDGYLEQVAEYAYSKKWREARRYTENIETWDKPIPKLDLSIPLNPNS